MRNRIVFVPLICLAASLPTFAQTYQGEKSADFNQIQFEQNLKNYLEQQPGVTLKGATEPFSIEYGLVPGSEIVNLLEDAPEFGIVAVDSNQRPVDIFGPNTPFEVKGDEISIPGYTVPAGGRLKMVGSAGWASTKAAIQEASSNLNTDIVNAIDTISAATDYIAESLCKKNSRPSKITLNLTAGFRLVFSAETGSQVEWELDKVCARMNIE